AGHRPRPGRPAPPGRLRGTGDGPLRGRDTRAGLRGSLRRPRLSGGTPAPAAPAPPTGAASPLGRPTPATPAPPGTVGRRNDTSGRTAIADRNRRPARTATSRVLPGPSTTLPPPSADTGPRRVNG